MRFCYSRGLKTSVLDFENLRSTKEGSKKMKKAKRAGRIILAVCAVPLVALLVFVWWADFEHIPEIKYDGHVIVRSIDGYKDVFDFQTNCWAGKIEYVLPEEMCNTVYYHHIVLEAGIDDQIIFPDTARARLLHEAEKAYLGPEFAEKLDQLFEDYAYFAHVRNVYELFHLTCTTDDYDLASKLRNFMRYEAAAVCRTLEELGINEAELELCVEDAPHRKRENLYKQLEDMYTSMGSS